MTKTFNVIEIEDYGIAVDDFQIKKGDSPCYCYNSIKNTWDNDIILYQGTMPEYHYIGFKKIIGSIGKRLDGVTLIELKLLKYSEEDIITAIKKAQETILVDLRSEEREHKYTFEEILQSLQKQFIPTEVTLKMEGKLERIGGDKGERFAGGQAGQMFYSPKIHNKETNTIIAVNYK